MAVKADFRDTQLKDLPKVDFPAAVYEEYRVHLKPEAYERMMAHARTTNEVELCGVLVGQVVRDQRGPFLMVSAVIEGENANNYGAQVTFTQQTWNHINEVKDRDFPKERIVGWYHTHPGFGVFLSGMDTFIQENFFNLPYQAAIVVETKQDKLGCFVWKNGQSTPLSRLWVGQEELALAGGTAESFDPVRMGTAALPAEGPRPAPAAYPEEPLAFRWLLGLAFAALTFMLGLQWGRAPNYQDFYNTLESDVYGVLEFASLSQVAVQDLMLAKEKVQAARKQLEGGEVKGAQAGLEQLSAELDRLEKVYHQSRSQLRDQLRKVTERRQLLGDRIDRIQDMQKEQNQYLATLFLTRLVEELGLSGLKLGSAAFPAELAALSEKKKDELRKLVDLIVRLSPELKPRFDVVIPGLIEGLYGSPKKAQPQEEGKPKLQDEAKPKEETKT